MNMQTDTPPTDVAPEVTPVQDAPPTNTELTDAGDGGDTGGEPEAFDPAAEFEKLAAAELAGDAEPGAKPDDGGDDDDPDNLPQGGKDAPKGKTSADSQAERSTPPPTGMPPDFVPTLPAEVGFDMAAFKEAMKEKTVKVDNEDRALTQILDDYPELFEVMGMMVQHAMLPLAETAQAQEQQRAQTQLDLAVEQGGEGYEPVPDFAALNRDPAFIDWVMQNPDPAVTTYLASGEPRWVAQVAHRYLQETGQAAPRQGTDTATPPTKGKAAATARRTAALSSTLRTARTPSRGAAPEPTSPEEARDYFEELAAKELQK